MSADDAMDLDARLERLLRADPPPPGPGFHARVMASIRTEAPARGRLATLRFPWKPVFAVLVVFALALVGVLHVGPGERATLAEHAWTLAVGLASVAFTVALLALVPPARARV